MGRAAPCLPGQDDVSWHHGRWPDEPPQHDGAPAWTRAGSTAPAPIRVQAMSRPLPCLRARATLGHTDDDGEDVVCATGPRQTAVDDTHDAIGRHRGVGTPG